MYIFQLHMFLLELLQPVHAYSYPDGLMMRHLITKQNQIKSVVFLILLIYLQIIITLFVEWNVFQEIGS